MLNIKKKMGEMFDKVDRAFDKALNLDGHYEPIIYEYVNENGMVFGRSQSFVWVKD